MNESTCLSLLLYFTTSHANVCTVIKLLLIDKSNATGSKTGNYGNCTIVHSSNIHVHAVPVNVHRAFFHYERTQALIEILNLISFIPKHQATLFVLDKDISHK